MTMSSWRILDYAPCNPMRAAKVCRYFCRLSGQNDMSSAPRQVPATRTLINFKSRAKVLTGTTSEVSRLKLELWCDEYSIGRSTQRIVGLFDARSLTAFPPPLLQQQGSEQALSYEDYTIVLWRLRILNFIPKKTGMARLEFALLSLGCGVLPHKGTWEFYAIHHSLPTLSLPPLAK